MHRVAWNAFALAAVVLFVLLTLPSGFAGVISTPPPSTVQGSSSMASPSHLSSGATPPAPASPGAVNISVANLTKAKALPYQFWGANVVATDAFGTSDANNLSATPTTFLRFPGGGLGEDLNYTSGLITNSDGTTQQATTTVASFISTCRTIHCNAILQLPAEIDEPQTAAYYASYVVNTLRFQPAYWEIGNSPPGWTHFGSPWSGWTASGGATVTPLGFAQLVGAYITAIKAVDPKAAFVAFGAAAGSYIKPWVSDLAALDGPNLTGIAIHSYTFGTAPANPTWAQLLANLDGTYSLTTQVNATRGYIAAACPSCSTLVFVTEANAAEVNNYTALDSTFAGTLYIASDVVQAIQLRLTNLDWYCYECNFSGTWISQTHRVQMQYTLFSQMLDHLGDETLPTTVRGAPTTFFATATYGASGLVLLMVNTNTTSAVSVSLAHTGITPGSSATRERWSNGSGAPGTVSVVPGSTISIPALSIELLTVGPTGLAKGYAPGPVDSNGEPPASTVGRATLNYGSDPSGDLAPSGGPPLLPRW